MELFHVKLPTSVSELSIDLANTNLSDSKAKNFAVAPENQYCIVCQITYMENSAFVWVGWGYMASERVPTKKTLARFGPLVVAFPKRFENGQLASSQLLHSSNEEENADIDIIGAQMASRLSKKVGWPIFVSCALGNAAELGMLVGGVDGVAQRGACLVEKEIGRRLMIRKE